MTNCPALNSKVGGSMSLNRNPRTLYERLSMRSTVARREVAGIVDESAVILSEDAGRFYFRENMLSCCEKTHATRRPTQNLSTPAAGLVPRSSAAAAVAQDARSLQNPGVGNHA